MQDALCHCANPVRKITSPIIDTVYTQLEDPNSLAVTVICNNRTVCLSHFSKKMELESSNSIFRLEEHHHKVSFAIGTDHVFLLSENLQCLFVYSWHDRIQNSLMSLHVSLLGSYGGEYRVHYVDENNPVCKKPETYTKDYEAKMEANNPRYWSISLLSSKSSLPVPNLNCFLPTLGDRSVKFRMISKTSAEIVVKTTWSTSGECQFFAKPELVFEVQYASISVGLTNFSQNFYCKNSDPYLITEMEVNCQTRTHKPTTRQQTHVSDNLLHQSFEFILENLRPGALIFLQIRVKPNVEENVEDMWLAGVKHSTVKTAFRANYSPPKSLFIWLWIIAPVIIILISLAVVAWLYNKQLYIYQYLPRLSARDISRECKLGEGNFGEVWKATIGGETIVIKMLKESATDREEKEFRDEALLLSKLSKCPNIVKPLGICLQTRPIMLALEFINGGSLDVYLRNPYVREQTNVFELLKITGDVLNGCTYLEAEGYIHRDLAARNCLVTLENKSCWKPCLTKLSDFGLAKDVGNETMYKARDTKSAVLPTAWTAPEAFAGHFSFKSDVWACGVLMWEIFSFAADPFGKCILENHRCPLLKLTHREIEDKVCNDVETLNDLPEPCTSVKSAELRRILTMCWFHDPEGDYTQIRSVVCET